MLQMLSEKEEIWLIKLFHIELGKGKDDDIGTISDIIESLGLNRSNNPVRDFLKSLIDEALLEEKDVINGFTYYQINHNQITKKLNNEGRIFNQTGFIIANYCTITRGPIVKIIFKTFPDT